MRIYIILMAVGIPLVVGSITYGTPVNLVLNPGFESWTDSLPDEWDVSTTNGGQVYADTIPLSPNNKYVVMSTAPGSPGPKPFDEANLSQPVNSFDTNFTYQLSFWYEIV